MLLCLQTVTARCGRIRRMYSTEVVKVELGRQRIMRDGSVELERGKRRGIVETLYVTYQGRV
jgi:hypothetical protein